MLPSRLWDWLPVGAFLRVSKHPGHGFRNLVADNMLDAVENRYALALLDTEKLIKRMHFFADVPAYGDAHQHELTVLCSVEHRAEILIFKCRLFDIFDVAFNILSISLAPFSPMLEVFNLPQALLCLHESAVRAKGTTSFLGEHRVSGLAFAYHGVCKSLTTSSSFVCGKET